MKVIDNSTDNRTALKSFIQFSYGTWILAIINLMAIPLTTWFISPDNFGKASMFTVLFNFIFNIVLLGTDQSFSRMYFEHTEKSRPRILGASIISPLILTVLCGTLIFVFWDFLSLLLFGVVESIEIAFILAFTLLSGVFHKFGLMLLRMQKSANRYSVLSIAAGVINVLIIISYSLFVERDFMAVIYGFFISYSAVAFISLFLNLKLWIKAAQKIDYSLTKEVIIYGFPFVPVFLIDWLFQATDKFYLRHYTSFEDIGLYAASFKIVTALNLLQAGFNIFWVPFSYEKYTSVPNDKTIYNRAFNQLTSILFIIIISLIFTKDLIANFLAESYERISTIIPFLVFIPVMYTLSEITVVGINFMKKSKYHILISVIALASNLILNYFLIPILGVKGAAISTSLSYIVFFISRTLFANKVYKISYSWCKFIISLICIFIFSIVASFLKSIIIINLTGILVGALCLFIYRREWGNNLKIIKMIKAKLKV